MSGYIDLHNHILPATDDGPADLKEALSLARELADQGYRKVAVTPHANSGRPERAVIKKKVSALQKALDAEKIPLTLYPGAEQHIEPETAALLAEGKLMSLNESRYLLLELPMFQPLPPYTWQVLARLDHLNYIPIIPHPERVVALQMNHQLLYQLYEAGALFQVTWTALSGLLGPAALKTANFMLNANLIHLLATDAHHPQSRLLYLDKAYSTIEKRLGKKALNQYLTTRPQQVLTDQSLELAPPLSARTTRPRRIPFLARLFKV